MTVNLRDLYRENAMMDEGGRVVRRFFRTGADTGKGLNYVIIGLVALFYVWFCAMIVRSHEDMSMDISLFQMVVMTMILPATVFTAISGERERSTWDALALTRLTPGQILAGKLGWRIALVLILMAVFAGPVWLSHMSGVHNVHPGLHVALAQVNLLTWFVLVVCLGLFVSANTKRSVTSVAVLYAVLLFTLILIPILISMFDLHTEISRVEDVMDVFAWLYTKLHPFITLDALSQNAAWSNQGDHMEPWSPVQWATILPGFYVAQAAFLLYLTHRSLKRLCRGRG
ncbi:MAG TPA: hypothetical protein VGM37_04840 [Armatimonadota bacterium]|jgi:ABC-type transport system involved in multi-copper enzyme maturation permease subunit